MPASVSENPCGLRIWFNSEETLLKKPTYTENGTKICQNSRVLVSFRTASPSGVCGFADDALAGVGGAAGRKNDGSAATVDCLVTWCVSKREKGPMDGWRFGGGFHVQ
jgi:hypothetical protein